MKETSGAMPGQAQCRQAAFDTARGQLAQAEATVLSAQPRAERTRTLPAGPVPAGCIAKGEVVVTVK
ncbi:hypothetical protein Q7C02_000160, partial [Stenotrophomonas sp. RAC2]|nr:hypothetical protein [Stenotrophomonas sp. RAC2]